MVYVPDNRVCTTIGCLDTFGVHYTSNNDKVTGCSRRDCPCSGFMMIVKAERPSRNTRQTLGYGGPGEPYGT